MKCTAKASFWPTTATATILPVKWRHFRVTSGHLRSCDVISCHVTASFCELQPSWKWNVQYTQVFGPLQALPGDFRSNYVTSGSLSFTYGHVILLPVTWLPPCELQPCRKWNILFTRVFDLLQPLPSDFRSNEVTSGSLTVTSGCITLFSVTWLPPAASYSLAGSEKYSIREVLALYIHFRVISGQITSLSGLFRSPEVTWRHCLSHDYLLLRATAL